MKSSLVIIVIQILLLVSTVTLWFDIARKADTMLIVTGNLSHNIPDYTYSIVTYREEVGASLKKWGDFVQGQRDDCKTLIAKMKNSNHLMVDEYKTLNTQLVKDVKAENKILADEIRESHRIKKTNIYMR